MQMVENIEKCLGCLNSKGVATEGLLAKDLHEGNLKSVLGLFFSLSRYKQLLQQEEQERRKKATAGGGKTVSQQRAQVAKQAQPPPPPRPNGHTRPSQAQLKATGARLAARPQATVNGTHLSVGQSSNSLPNPTNSGRSTPTQSRVITNGSTRSLQIAAGNNSSISGRIPSSSSGSDIASTRSLPIACSNGHNIPGIAAAENVHSVQNINAQQARAPPESLQTNGSSPVPHSKVKGTPRIQRISPPEKPIFGSHAARPSTGRSHIARSHTPPEKPIFGSHSRRPQTPVNETTSSPQQQARTGQRLSVPSGVSSPEELTETTTTIVIKSNSHQTTASGQSKTHQPFYLNVNSGSTRSAFGNVTSSEDNYNSLSETESVQLRRPSRRGSASSTTSSVQSSGIRKPSRGGSPASQATSGPRSTAQGQKPTGIDQRSNASGLRSNSPGLRTNGSVQAPSSSGIRTNGSVQAPSSSGLRTNSSGLRTSNQGQRSNASGARTSSPGQRTASPAQRSNSPALRTNKSSRESSPGQKSDRENSPSQRSTKTKSGREISPGLRPARSSRDPSPGTNMPKPPSSRTSHGGSSSSSTSGVQRRQPPGGSSQNSGSSSARSSTSDLGSRIPTPNSRAAAAAAAASVVTKPSTGATRATSGSDRSRGPSPVPSNHGAIPGTKKSSSSSSQGIPSSSSSNLKPPGSSIAAPRSSSASRSQSPSVTSSSSSKVGASKLERGSKARSSSAPAQKGIPPPKASSAGGGVGKPPTGVGASSAGEKAGSKVPPPSSAAANNAKGSMLTKLKIFGKDGKLSPPPPAPSGQEKEQEKPAAKAQEKTKEPASSKPKPGLGKSAIGKPAPPKRDIPSGRQSAVKKTITKEAKESKLAPPSTKVEKKAIPEPSQPIDIEPRVSIDRTNSGGAISPGLTLGSGSPKAAGSSSPKNTLKAVAQKTIGRAFSGAKGRISPKLGHKEYMQSETNGDLSDEGSKLHVPESKLKSKLPVHGSDTESIEGGKVSGLKAPSSKLGTSKVKPVQPVSSQQHAGPGSSSSSSRGIPKPGAASRSGLKAPSSYAARKTESLAPPTVDKEAEEKITYTRGGAYSPVPPKKPPEPIPTIEPEPVPAASDPCASPSPVVKATASGRSSITTSPSHNRSPANTATVAPFNYTGSRPSSKDCSETTSASASNDTDSVNSTPIHSQISISSTTSHDSENSVIYLPNKAEEDFCTTVYKNDKAVTTFGTPKQQRAFKSIPDVQETPDYTEVTVMNSQVGQRATPNRATPNRATKETTFGDSITTQLKEASSSRDVTTPDAPSAQRTASLGRRGSLGSATKHTGGATVAVSIPTDTMSEGGDSMSARGDQSQQQPPAHLSKAYLNSMRRTFSNRSHLNDLKFTTDQNLIDDCNDYVSEDIASGYVSDGDILHRSVGLGGDIASGYMSEGGGTLYARRIGMSFKNYDGMAAVREYLSKSMDLSDEGSLDDSSSISSGISDTIAEISTDDNVTGSSRNSCDSSKNLELCGEPLSLDSLSLVKAATDKNAHRKSASKSASPRREKSKNGDGGIGGAGSKVNRLKHPSKDGKMEDADGKEAVTPGDRNTVKRATQSQSQPTRGQLPPSGSRTPGAGPPSWQRSLDRLQAKHRQQFGRDPNFLMRVSPGGRMGTVTGNGTLKDGLQKGNGNGLQGDGQRAGQFGFGYRRNGGQSPVAKTPNGSRMDQPRPTNIASRTGSLGRSGKASLEGSLSDVAGLDRQRSPRGADSPLGRTSDKSPRGESPGARSSRITSPGKAECSSALSPPGEGLRYGSLKRGQFKSHGQIARHIMQELKSGSSSGQLSGDKCKSQALKSLFGRGTRDSGIEDTIISNPHATFCKDNNVLDMRNTARGALSDSEHSMSYMTSPQALRRRSQNSTLTDGMLKSAFSDATQRCSGYVSDSYASMQIGGLSSLHGISSPYLRSNKLSGVSALKQSDSMESLESNNSSAMSVSSHAASERYGPTQTAASVMRSNSLRSTLSEKQLQSGQSGLTAKDLEDMAWLRAGNFGLVAGGEKSGNISPTGSTVSQPPLGYFPAATTSTSSTSMVRSNSLTASAFTQPFTSRGRNGSVSLDERQRAGLSLGVLTNDGAEELNGSCLSLVSTSSSLYSTPEDRAASEIRRLRRELEREQGRVGNLSSQLHNNAHVVAAFEQSLSNMTNRLQRLTNNADQKDSELQDLKDKIEQLKVAHISSGQGLMSNGGLGVTNGGLKTKLSTNNNTASTPKDNISTEGRMTRQMSTDSMSSLASMTSMSSVGSAVTDTEMLESKKKKKKNWVPMVGQNNNDIRSSFRAAFTRSRKKSGTTTDVEDLDSNMSLSNGSLPTNGQLKTSASTSAIYDEPADIKAEEVTDLKKQLRDKESKLTDVKLEALSSQHQLDQLKEMMNKMKNEMSVLKSENERLQRQVQSRRSLEANSSQASLNSMGSSKRLSRDSLDRHRLSAHSDHSSLDILLDDNSGMTSNSKRIVVTVALGGHRDQTVKRASVSTPLQEVLIGTIGISSKTNWDTLDSVVRRIFKEYVLRIDPVTNLGLSSESITCYVVGEMMRTKDSEQPELLPCGYLVGENTSIRIFVKDHHQNSCDSLVFETLIPKPIMQRYVSLLMEHRRIIMCGPSGTGKTYLAQKLAEYIVHRLGKEVSAEFITTFNVDHKSGKELKQYLSSLAEQCESASNEMPLVVILDNLHHAGSLGDIFSGFIKYQKCPYIIGTMNQATCSSTNLQLHHNFRWVLCANHMEPVKGFLGRYLRRKLVEHEIGHNARNNDLIKMVEWMPRVWLHLNKFLETHSSSDVTIGPRLFLSCPVDLAGSQVWFTDLWNYSIVPYLLEAVREGLQLYGRKASWEDPAEWVIDSYPWSSSSNQDWPSLLRLRPEDVGFDGYSMHSGVKGSTQGQQGQSEAEGDPLFNMLMRLQEAANCSNSHPYDSDTNSMDSIGMSNEDISVEITV